LDEVAALFAALPLATLKRLTASFKLLWGTSQFHPENQIRSPAPRRSKKGLTRPEMLVY
jgi:hypothetical protein